MSALCIIYTVSAQMVCVGVGVYHIVLIAIIMRSIVHENYHATQRNDRDDRCAFFCGVSSLVYYQLLLLLIILVLIIGRCCCCCSY
jgi:hypothetical protein